MDKAFRWKRTWLIVGVVAIIFLCLAVLGTGAMVAVLGRSVGGGAGPVAGVEPAQPPQVYHGPGGLVRYGGTGVFGLLGMGLSLIFKFLFFGLLLLLLIGLVRRVFWGPRHWHHRYMGPHHRGKPPKGKEWKHRPHAWGPPWAWHRHDEAEDEFATEDETPNTADPAPGEID